MVKDADLLVVHHAISESDTGIQSLHRLPSQIGDLGAAANPKHLILFHNMQRSLAKLEESLKLIQERYKGKVDVAKDLNCYVLK